MFFYNSDGDRNADLGPNWLQSYVQMTKVYPIVLLVQDHLHPLKIRKYLSNVHKIEGAHLPFVNNHYAKFEFKTMSCRLHKPDTN